MNATRLSLAALLFLLACGALGPAVAQEPKGAITPALIARIQQRSASPAERALADIVANGDIQEVALNRARYIAHDPLVNHRIKTGEITNQKGSGRCWMFAGFNVLRPHVLRRHKLASFEFSQNFLMFWDKLEKANLFLQGMIDMADRPLDDRYVENLLDEPLGDGGWWSYFVDLVEKYGVVPKEAMPETHNSSATGRMNGLLTLKLKQMGLRLRDAARGERAADDLRAEREAMLAEFYRLLVFHLGEPPRRFVWRYESKDSTSIVTYPDTLTPRRFLEEVVTFDLDDYVALFNYPGKDYLRTYAFELSRNIYDRPDFTLLNVPIDSLKACVLRSVLDSTAVWFACDVGRENYGEAGILAPGIYNYEEIYGTDFALPKKDLIRLGLITPNHAMTFIGVDTLATRPRKWLVENSWGADRGDGGLWYMYDDWFDRYLFGAIVHRRYLPAEFWDLAGREPVVLPPWDPMSALSRLDRASFHERSAPSPAGLERVTDR